jgi:ubiquinone/menaquinone biosynthesis C-methylase UbiE
VATLRNDYSGVTETPGTLVTVDAASMALSRYEVVRRLSQGRRVLEIACGAGQGLGYVSASAGFLVGGDITGPLLATAHAHYGDRVPLVQFDAHALPFTDASFDVIQLHEALYYMAHADQVFAECCRVLAPAGVLVISSINPGWSDFNPSPYSTTYFDASQLKAVLERFFDRAEISFGFKVAPAGARQQVASIIKRTAVRLRLIPRTMSGKALLKRIFLGPLLPMPAELCSTLAPVDEPSTAPMTASASFRILYAVAHR